MSKLTKQLREAIEQTTPIDVEYSPLTPHGEGIKKLQDLLPSLLDEHERLERESEAGKVLAKTLDELEDNPEFLDHTGWYSQSRVDEAVETYRSACEGEK